jgi:Mn2+/Fe2+ NRAMP family transporter
MWLLMRIATNASIMGQFTISRRSRFLGWSATAVMAVASAGFIVSQF